MYESCTNVCIVTVVQMGMTWPPCIMSGANMTLGICYFGNREIPTLIHAQFYSKNKDSNNSKKIQDCKIFHPRRSNGLEIFQDFKFFAIRYYIDYISQFPMRSLAMLTTISSWPTCCIIFAIDYKNEKNKTKTKKPKAKQTHQIFQIQLWAVGSSI